jgi:hypothetical protein
MSDADRLRRLLLDIQQNLNRLGNTNRARWTFFSPDIELTHQQFASRLSSCCRMTITPQDTATLWRATGITGDRMQFGDFVRFLQTEAMSVRPSSSSDISSVSLLDTMRQNRRAVLMKFIEADPTTTGQISHRAFADLCSWFSSSESPDDVRGFIARYDPANSGRFSYFVFMADLCDGQARPPPADVPRPTPKVAPIDTSFDTRPSRLDLSDIRPPPRLDVTRPDLFDAKSPRIDAAEVRSTRGPGSGSGGRTRLDPVIFGEPATVRPASGSGGRGNLDPAIFGESVRRRASGEGSGGRGQLDPAIFGARRTTDDLPEQPKLSADDIPGAERVDGLTPNQLISLISRQVSQVSRGSKQVYNKWRGAGDFLDAASLRDGLARDANICVPLRDLQVIVTQYGGPMSMSTFVRMLGDGAKFAEQSASIGGVQRATEDEATLIKIADQVIGSDWQEAILRSRTAEDVVRGFARQEVHVTEPEIWALMSKLGKTGLIDAIRARIQ